MDAEYRISNLSNNIYTVENRYGSTLFQGSLADCEAYVRLQDNDNVDFYE